MIAECFECCDWPLTMLTATLELCVLPCNSNTINSQIQIQIYSVNGASHSFVLYKLKPCSELARSTDATAPGSVFGHIFCPSHMSQRHTCVAKEKSATRFLRDTCSARSCWLIRPDQRLPCLGCLAAVEPSMPKCYRKPPLM